MVETLDKHEAMLRDLQSERKALDLLIAAYENYFAAKRGANRQAGLFSEPEPQIRAGVVLFNKDRPITIYDGCERILRDEMRPLHVKELVKRLAVLGKRTSPNSVMGALPQDPKSRFKKTAPGTFGLSVWEAT